MIFDDEKISAYLYFYFETESHVPRIFFFTQSSNFDLMQNIFRAFKLIQVENKFIF